MRAKHFIQVAVVMMVVVGLGLSTTHAATISVLIGPEDTFTVSNSDLIEAGQSTLSSIVLTSGTALYGSSVAKLNNGDIYGDLTPSSTGDSLTPSNGAVVTVALNTVASPLGYNIDSIVTLVGANATDRNGQKFDLWYSLVATPDTFVYVDGHVAATVDQANGGSFGGDHTEVQSTITGNSPIATGVAKLQFEFYNRSLECLYREIDVFGAPVPEPSTLALLATGLVGLLCYAWRKRKCAPR